MNRPLINTAIFGDLAPTARDSAAARVTPHAARAAVEIVLSGPVSLMLRLGAAAAGLEDDEFIRRAIVEKAARQGLRELADARIPASMVGMIGGEDGFS